MFDIGCFWKMH